MLSRSLLLSAVALSAIFVHAVSGDPAPAKPKQASPGEIRRLVRQLGSPQFTERQAASIALGAIEEPALEALQEAAANSEDAEIRRRATLLVERIRSLDYERLQGTWVVVKVVTEYGTLPDRHLKDLEVVITGRQVKYVLPKGTILTSPERTTYRLDRSKSPREIDMTEYFGRNNIDEPQRTYKGIYLLEGDQLTVCFNGGGPEEKRPTRFAAERGSLNGIVVLKRCRR